MHAHAVARSRAALLVVAALVLLPATLPAQQHDVHLQDIRVPAWVNTRSMIVLNALVGGLSAAVVSELRGGSGARAFASGAAGGVVAFLGKEIAGRRFEGAGLVGRQVAAVGGSIVQNAAYGLGPLDRIEFPFGPVDVLLDTRTRSVSGRLDPIGAGVIVIGVFHPRMYFDANATLSAGIPVFRTRSGMLSAPWSGVESCGLEVASVLFLADLGAFDPGTRAAVVAHERVHTLQGDLFQAYWGRPLLEWLLPESPRWQSARPFLDVNFGDGIAELTDALFFSAYASRPWEIEAEALALRR
jgi:hypothetical protein